jgi:hypothetical protein
MSSTPQSPRDTTKEGGATSTPIPMPFVRCIKPCEICNKSKCSFNAEVAHKLHICGKNSCCHKALEILGLKTHPQSPSKTSSQPDMLQRKH